MGGKQVFSRVLYCTVFQFILDRDLRPIFSFSFTPVFGLNFGNEYLDYSTVKYPEVFNTRPQLSSHESSTSRIGRNKQKEKLKTKQSSPKMCNPFAGKKKEPTWDDDGFPKPGMLSKREKTLVVILFFFS